MEKNNADGYKYFLGIFVFIAFFLGVSFLVQKNLEYLTSIIQPNFIGIFGYGLLNIIATVFAPINLVPLMPLATAVFGWETTALTCIVSWTIGSSIAFLIAKKYGVRVVKKFVSEENLEKVRGKISNKYLFLNVVWLRVLFPGDVLSYALGLFSDIKLRWYALATFIGLIPAAFMYAYIGKIPFEFQVIFFIVFAVILIIIYNVKRLRKKLKLGSNKSLMALLSIFLALLVVLGLVFFANYEVNYEGRVIVNEIIDGDTIRLSNGEIVRLLCIDAPEVGEEGYEDSVNYLNDLILYKEVKLEKGNEDLDDYGRSLRYVYLEDVLINQKLLERDYVSFNAYNDQTCEKLI